MLVCVNPRGIMNQRQHTRHSFEFLVLEHRPEGEIDGPASRVLSCLTFSKGGMLLKGQPRFDMFPVTLSAPQDGAKLDATVEVVSGDGETFGVKFVNPSKELLSKLSWWDEKAKRPKPSPSRSVDIGV